MEVDTEAIRLSCTPTDSLESLYRTVLYKLDASYTSEIKNSVANKSSEGTGVSGLWHNLLRERDPGRSHPKCACGDDGLCA